MKRYRIISLILILVCLLPMTVQAKGGFTDVSPKKWYYDEVMRAYDEGIMVGVSDDKFAPESPLTREMFVTALSRIAMTSVEEYHEHKSVFTDVKTDKWYSDAIEWAVTDGIVHGVTDTEFGVGQNVTREQIAAFVYRFINAYLYNVQDVESPSDEFTDKPSKYAREAVEFMRKTGLMSGKGNGVFAPRDNATRAECAAILLRLKDTVAECGFRLSFDAGDISQMGVFCAIHTKDIIVTDDAEIQKFTEYLNNTPIERAEFVGDTAGWDHSISIYDGGGDKVFTLYFTQSHFLLSECLYTVQEDYFKPIVDKVK